MRWVVERGGIATTTIMAGAGRQRVESRNAVLAVAHEDDDFGVRHDRRLIHAFVVREERLTTSRVADEELPVYEVVTTHLITAQQRVELTRVRRSVREKPDPDRGDDEDTAECLAGEVRSHRRGVL